MKKFLLASAIAAVFLPGFAAAAFNDVTMTTDARLSSGSVTLAISGSTASIESLTVTGTTISFTLLSGSSVTIVDSSGHLLKHNADPTYVSTNTCTSGVSTLKFSSSSATVTITVTPDSSTLCASGQGADSAGGNTSGNSGGSGGSGSSTSGGSSAVTTTTPTSPTTANTTPSPTVPTPSTNSTLVAQLQVQLNALLAQIAALKGGPSVNAFVNANANASFKRNLQVGSTGSDAMALQVYLNAHGFPVAASGPGSPGNETTKFGGFTRAALAKWQASVGISPAAGYFGPKTRAYITSHP